MQYFCQNSILGMTPTQPQWRRGTWSTRGIDWRQVSQASVPEIHSQRERSSQSPNPPALPYPSQTRVLAASTLDHHDNMSARLCSSLLKSADMGDSSVLQCAMSNTWPFTRRWNAWPVSPTYCWPHLLHVINMSRWRIYRRLGFWPWKISVADPEICKGGFYLLTE